jgi:hypothetical protein
MTFCSWDIATLQYTRRAKISFLRKWLSYGYEVDTGGDYYDDR